MRPYPPSSWKGDKAAAMFSSGWKSEQPGYLEVVRVITIELAFASAAIPQVCLVLFRNNRGRLCALYLLRLVGPAPLQTSIFGPQARKPGTEGNR